MPLGLFRKRTKTTLADGTKKVIVTDRKGTVRKQKLVKPGGIKEKQKYNKAGNIHTAKLKGPNIKKKKIDAKGLGITNINTPGYKWADNPNRASKKKVVPKKTTVVDKKVTPKKDTTTTKKTTISNNTPIKTNKTTTKKQTFGEAYSTQRKKNLKNKIANFGDSKGYFTYEGKKYNTESREEKAIRTTKKTTTPKTTEKKNTSTSSVVDDITKGKKNNNKSNEKTGNMNFFGKGGPVKGTGQWAGKNVPGMRKGR